MQDRWLRLTVVAPFLLAAPVVLAAPSPPDVRAAIEATGARLSGLLAKGDAAGIASLYTSMAMVLPPEGDLVSGREAIQKMWQGLVDSGLKLELTTTDVEAQGDFAHEVGTYVVKDKGGSVSDRGKYVVVWRREGGAWKLHRDIWNTSLPVPAAKAPGEPKADASAQEGEVRSTEEAFARTMADRDHAAFTSLLAEDTVFYGRELLRGRDAVAAGWKRFYEGAKAPFSWKPDRVAVIGTGGLGLSSGPVFDPDGKRIGTFNSVWRREPGGGWKIVMDSGCPPCDCP